MIIRHWITKAVTLTAIDYVMSELCKCLEAFYYVEKTFVQGTIMRSFAFSLLLVWSSCWTNIELPMILDTVMFIYDVNRRVTFTSSYYHSLHDDVIKWKRFPRDWWIPPQRPVMRSFDVFLDLRLEKGWANNRDTGDLKRHWAYDDVTIMSGIM